MADLAALRESLDAWRRDAVATDAFVRRWQNEAGALSESLPPAFRQVLDDVLMRIESSRLFTADSCSFSRTPLADALQTWLDKASQRLAC